MSEQTERQAALGEAVIVAMIQASRPVSTRGVDDDRNARLARVLHEAIGHATGALESATAIQRERIDHAIRWLREVERDAADPSTRATRIPVCDAPIDPVRFTSRDLRPCCICGNATPGRSIAGDAIWPLCSFHTEEGEEP